jgi:uncharacterized protein
MRKVNICTLGIVLATAFPAAIAQNTAAISGHYAGEMIREGRALKISIDLPRQALQTRPRYACPMHPKVTSATPGKCPICDMPLELLTSANESRATFTSLSQAVLDYPFDSLAVKGDTLHFVLGGTIVFDGRASVHHIDGQFRGPDGTGEFHLESASTEVRPYTVREVTFHHGDVTLAGSLLTPNTLGKHAGVVLLHGSGPETRWGTPRYIADRFARAGIATLIYDKRGSGRSTGNLDSFTYDDLAGDAIAGVHLLASQPDVDRRRVGLLGHSEGGITGVVAAVHASREIAFIVAEDTVAGPVYKSDLYRVNRSIRQTGFKPEEISKAMDVFGTFVDVARGVTSYSELEAARNQYGQTEWFRWLAIPPRDAPLWATAPQRENLNTLVYWSKVDVPVLLIYGEKDELVPVVQNIEAIENALDRRASFTAVIAPGAQHNLTVHPPPEGPFFWWRAAPGIVDLTVNWVQSVTSTPQGRGAFVATPESRAKQK